MFENVRDWVEGSIILILTLATFRKEIVKLFKKDKKVVDIKKTIFDERLFEAKLALNKCNNLMGDNFPVKDPRQIRAFENIRYLAFFKSGEGSVREILRENGFLHDYPTTKEFEAFVNNRKVTILESVSDGITAKYTDEDFEITRQDLKKHNQKIVPQCFTIIEDFFWTCRRIEERYEAEEKKKNEKAN